MTQLRVAVVGAAGYAGGELLRLLLQHPDVGECVATSRSQAGKPIAEVHPTLAPLTDARFSGATPGEIARGRDVVFLALEHGESSRLAEAVFEAGPGLVIDLAADFRVQSPRLYERFYGPHPSPDFVSRFAYGLADIAGQSLRGATAIAAPGCFATAAQLALYPLANLPLAAAPSLFAITGSSGAGVHPKPTTHHPARANNVFAYSVAGHRHEAEVLQAWRAWTGSPDASARLMVHSGPFVRGIYLTMHAQIAAGAAPAGIGAPDAGVGATAGIHGARAGIALPRLAPGANGGADDVGDLAGLYRRAYEGGAFVRVLDHAPELTHAVGTNYALIHATVSDDGRDIQVMVAIDNLIKGAGGQAIQAMNLALGLPERSGLSAVGVFPC